MHKANFPSRSLAMMLIASAAITLRASSTQEAELSRHCRTLGRQDRSGPTSALQSLMTWTADAGRAFDRAAVAAT